jgi:hypothetical protein
MNLVMSLSISTHIALCRSSLPLDSLLWAIASEVAFLATLITLSTRSVIAASRSIMRKAASVTEGALASVSELKADFIARSIHAPTGTITTASATAST